MAKIRKYALTALAIVAFLTLMFLLYKGTQRNEATPGRTATPSVSTSSAPASRALVRAPLSRGKALATMLGVRLRDRSARREEPVRVELDPTRLW